MKTKFSGLALLVIVSMLLTACSISITTKVNEDGSGTLGFAYKFTKDELSQLGGMGLNEDTICVDMQEQSDTMPMDLTLKQEKHGDEIWCIGEKEFDTLDELKDEMDGDGFTINTLEIANEKFTFDADADMDDTDIGIPISITINYDLTAPGKIDKDKSDADKYDGNTATWNLILGGSKSMHLESSTKGGAGFEFKTWYLIPLVCCCLLILIVIAVVVFFVMKKRPKQPSQPVL